MVYNCVTMIIKKGKMDEFLAECRKIRSLVLAEKGCLMYDYTQAIYHWLLFSDSRQYRQ